MQCLVVVNAAVAADQGSRSHAQGSAQDSQPIDARVEKAHAAAHQCCTTYSMLNFANIEALHSVLSAVYKAQEGPAGVALFQEMLQSELHFSPQQAEKYSRTVLTRNSNGSADFVNMNAYKLVGTWSAGNSKGSAGNLLVTKTESWIFNEDLTYEHKNESYEGYVSPLGGGYSRPRASSTYGIWAPSDVLSSAISIIMIKSDGSPRTPCITWTQPDERIPHGMLFDGDRFGRM